MDCGAYRTIRPRQCDNPHMAMTLVYFYDSSISWVWGCDDFIQEEYVKSDLHHMMRELSEEIGLSFIAVDIGGAMQCGSSINQFMWETLPPLIEEHRTDIVFFGLCNERTFWSWRELGFIYLPTYASWFEPTPLDFAFELSLRYFPFSSIDGTHDIAYLVDEIRAALEERNQQGRIASWPMSTRMLFPLAAAEYGVRWMQGEVPQEGIDIHILEQIMIDIIAGHTGLQHGATLTALAENGVVYENYILVLPDYLMH